MQSVSLMRVDPTSKHQQTVRRRHSRVHRVYVEPLATSRSAPKHSRHPVAFFFSCEFENAATYQLWDPARTAHLLRARRRVHTLNVCYIVWRGKRM